MEMPIIKRFTPNIKTLELLVVTPVDIDHIDGIVMMLNQKILPFTIKEVWFNGYNELQKRMMICWVYCKENI